VANGRQALLARARDEFARGQPGRSRELCAAILADFPGDPEGLHLLAILDLSSGDAHAALASVEGALRRDARDAKKHQTHGLALRALGRRGDSAAAFRRALQLAPAFPEAHGSLALALMEEGDLIAAASHYERALQGRADVYSWTLSLGLCRSHLGDAHGAAAAFERAARIDPRAAEPHNNLGIALLAGGRFEEAEAGFRRAIALAPGHSHAWTNLGNVLRRGGRAREAEEAYRRATQCEPPLAIAWVNLGNALKSSDRIDDAMQCFARAEAIAPGLPETYLSRAVARLLAGDLERGWEDYRWRIGSAPDAAAREGVQEAIRAGTPIEIRGEQGLGDALFFLRWAPALHAAGAKLFFRGDPRLFPLLEPAGLFSQFTQDAAPAQGALELPAGDLPWAAQRLAAPYPHAFPLRPSPESLEAAGRLLQAAGAPPYVGVAWRAGLPSMGSEHLHKMVPLEALGAVLRTVPGTIVSLQRGPAPGELAALASHAGRPAVDAQGANEDLSAMLGLIAKLDEYVGVSSTNVHLRAGLGGSARILVPAPPEWRYGRAGTSSPWFPAFTLYREERESGWAGALRDLGADLQRVHAAP
jgi:tetratricopeptide (TPR) repeat protein